MRQKWVFRIGVGVRWLLALRRDEGLCTLQAEVVARKAREKLKECVIGPIPGFPFVFEMTSEFERNEGFATLIEGLGEQNCDVGGDGLFRKLGGGPEPHTERTSIQ